MYAHPWALHDIGVEDALEELISVGIDGLQLALSYHVATFLAPMNPRRKIVYGGQGTLYIDPLDPSRAHEWPVSPPVSSLVPANWAREFLSRANRRGMPVAAWVVYLYNHNIARLQPELAVRNSFGDANGAQLCPANPAVRSYSLKLTAALLEVGSFDRYHVESLSYLPFDYGFLGKKTAVAPRGRARDLLGLCFCSHCRAAASARGIDAEDLAVEVCKVLDAYLNQLPDAAASEIVLPPEVEDQLREFTSLREATVLDLQMGVFDLVKRAGIRVSSNLAEDAVNGEGAGGQLRRHVDIVRVRIRPEMTVDEISRARDEITASAKPQIPVYAFYNLSQFDSRLPFVESLESAAAAGLSHFGFYEFSILSRRQMEWLGEAKHFWGK